jgi:hypothetical protein
MHWNRICGQGKHLLLVGTLGQQTHKPRSNEPALSNEIACTAAYIGSIDRYTNSSMVEVAVAAVTCNVTTSNTA